MISPVTTKDYYCWYDGLYQVSQHLRGDLAGSAPDYTGISGSPAQDGLLCYDRMGHWFACDHADPALDQDRTFNKCDEIASINGPGGMFSRNTMPSEKLTVSPKLYARETRHTLIRHVWNWLVWGKEQETEWI